jgi:hypothetical protein
MHRVIGVRTIPLAYVISPDATVPTICPQAAGTPHSVKHEAIDAEMIAEASHGHLLFREDNFNFTLGRFIAQHRNAFVSMQAAAKHVTYQIPNLHSRVGYLLDAIRCSDAGLQDAMATIKTDQVGLPNDFEGTASFLLPYDPVQKKRNDHGTKRGPADISDATSKEAYANVSFFGTKKGNGFGGVPLRYHKKEELPNKAQRAELHEWRSNKSTEGAGKKKDGDRKFDTAKAIASAVNKKASKRMKSIEQEKSTNDDTDAYITSLVDKRLAKSGKIVQISDRTATASLTKPRLLPLLSTRRSMKG